jgi:hypothetical protein
VATSTKSRKKNYSSGAQKKVEKVMRERKRGTLRSGGSGKRVTSRKQAIAIGLSEARRAGEDVPEAPGSKKKASKKSKAKKRTAKKKTAKKTTKGSGAKKKSGKKKSRASSRKRSRAA